MPYMTDKSSRSTHTLAGGHRERTASGMPYRKQSHDCRGVILSVTMMILIVITAFRLPPQGASKAFLISWHSASLIPRGQDPTPIPCQPVYVFKIWKDERKQVPFVFLFPIATVSGKTGFPRPELCSCLQAPYHISRRGAAEAEKVEGFSEVPGSGWQQFSNFLSSCGANLKASGEPLVFHPSSFSIIL